MKSSVQRQTGNGSPVHSDNLNMSYRFSGLQLPSSDLEIPCANFLPQCFSTGPFFLITDTLTLTPYHHPLTLSIIFRAWAGIIHLAPQRLSNNNYCKIAQQSPWAEHTKWKDVQRKLLLGHQRATAHPSSFLLCHTGCGVTQTLLPLTGVGFTL